MRMLLFAFTLLVLATGSRAETRLLMLEEKWCEWCQLWDREVGVVYHKTTEGKAAPLMRHDIRETLPDGVTLARRANYTPTFVLLQDGVEFGRIEGYPGEDFFYGLLQKLLETAAQKSGEGT